MGPCFVKIRTNTKTVAPKTYAVVTPELNARITMIDSFQTGDLFFLSFGSSL